MANVFTKSENFKSEYSSACVKIEKLTPIEDSDFLAKTNVLGTQIVVRKDLVHEGDTMIYCANETQLNERFLSVNNLFEISCREKNANAEEVAKIMEEYAPIKSKADRMRSEAKNYKGTMESLTKKANKKSKELAKLEKKLETMEVGSEEYNILKEDIQLKKAVVDELLSKAMLLTTKYTNLKKDIEDLVNSGKHIVDEAKKHCGFFNKYGRVRCITLKGAPSFGFLFSPEELFKYDNTVTMEDIEDYIGQEFDTINGELFVKVFIPPMPKESRRNNANKAQKKIKRFDRMIDGEFFFHYDSTQLEKTINQFKPEDIIDVSTKIHGTSSIFAKVKVKKPIRWKTIFFGPWNFAMKLFHLPLIKTYKVEYGPVYSSRTVIKNRYINSSTNGGYYNADIWTEYGDIVYPYLDEGMTVYGEIFGYITGSDKPIQKTYDYGCKPGENNIMFYRITTDEDGKKREWEVQEVFAWTKDLIERMKANNDENWKKIHPIDILYHGTLEELYPDLDTENHWHENLLEKLKNDKEHFGMEENEPLCTYHQVPREGICVRKYADPIRECYKLKTVSFKLGEAIRYDSNDVDIEAVEGYAESPNES